MAVSILEILYITFIVLVSIVVFAVASFAFYLHFFVHQKYKHIPGPPRRSFFLGNLPSLIESSKEDKHFGDIVTEWVSEYGPVIVIYLLNKVIVTANSPEAVKEFVVSDKHPKSKENIDTLATICGGSRLFGKGLLTETDHDIWHRKRVICNPAFHRKSQRNYMNQFNTSADLMVERLSKMADGKTEVVLLEEFARITTEVIAKVAFDLDLYLFQQEDNKFFKAGKTIFQGIDFQHKNPFHKYNPAPSMRKYFQEVAEACQILRETGRECVKKRLQAKSRNEPLPKDLLTLLIEADEQFEDFNGEVDWTHILDEFVTFFIAGEETTANTLAFTFLELCQHPEIMRRVQTEINAVVGDCQEVQFEDLMKLPYTSAVLKESLRMYPPVVATTRDAACDTTLHGIKIKKGTEVAVFMYTVSHLDKYFKDPLVFEPDRFLCQQEILPRTYLPFSTGPRSCIGQQFAMMEAKVLITKLLTKFQFELVPDQSFNVLLEGTLKLKDGCKVYMKPREDVFEDIL